MTELRQREPRVECPAFLAFVRRRPCCCCGAPAPSQAAHIRMASIAMGKRSTGKGERPSDRWCVPLCHDCHLDGPEAQHKVGEQRFWYRVGIDPCSLAAAMYAQFERRQARSPEQRERVVKRAVSIKRAKTRHEKLKFVVIYSNPNLRPAIAHGRMPNRWPPKGSQKIPTRRKSNVERAP